MAIRKSAKISSPTSIHNDFGIQCLAIIQNNFPTPCAVSKHSLYNLAASDYDPQVLCRLRKHSYKTVLIYRESRPERRTDVTTFEQTAVSPIRLYSTYVLEAFGQSVKTAKHS
jgi:hypothetical protein